MGGTALPPFGPRTVWRRIFDVLDLIETPFCLGRDTRRQHTAVERDCFARPEPQVLCDHGSGTQTSRSYRRSFSAAMIFQHRDDLSAPRPSSRWRTRELGSVSLDSAEFAMSYSACPASATWQCRVAAGDKLKACPTSTGHRGVTPASDYLRRLREMNFHRLRFSVADHR